MELSREQEQKILEENMKKIYRAVDNFSESGKTSPVRIPYEDFVQEVSIVFLEYIRKCKTEEEIEKFPWHDAKHSMSMLVLNSQPVTYPKTTANFREIINSVPKTVSYETLVTQGMDVDGMSKHWVQDKETWMDFEAFMASQDYSVSRMAAMKLEGITARKVASQFGVSESAICKKLRKLREKYDEFNEEGEE